MLIKYAIDKIDLILFLLLNLKNDKDLGSELC